MFVYVIGPDKGPYKVGYTNNLKKRLDAIQNGSPVDLVVHFSVKVPTAQAARRLEAQAHRQLRDCRVRGEWFACESHRIVAILAVAQSEHRPLPACLDHDKRTVTNFNAWLDHEGFSMRAAAVALGCGVSSVCHWKKQAPPKYILMACYGITMGVPPIQ